MRIGDLDVFNPIRPSLPPQAIDDPFLPVCFVVHTINQADTVNNYAFYRDHRELTQVQLVAISTIKDLKVVFHLNDLLVGIDLDYSSCISNRLHD